MARIPAATRENVPQDQVAEFDRMVESLGGVPPYGPGSVMIHVPKAHQAATELNQYLRNESSLPEAALELSMFLGGAGVRLPAHLERPRGRRPCRRCAGCGGGQPSATGRSCPLSATWSGPSSTTPASSSSTGASAVERSRTPWNSSASRALIELTLVIGNYSFLAFVINAFDPDLPPNRTEPLLPG